MATRRAKPAIPRWDVVITAAVLAALAGLYALFAAQIRWSGTRWWERATYASAHGQDIYTLNYAIWVTHSEPEPFFIYGPGSLYGTVPLYLLARWITGSETPDLFSRLCVVWTALAHAGLVLAGTGIVRRQSGSRGASVAAAAALALNPILLRLGAMGDLLDLTMLFLCALYLRSAVEGRLRGAGLWLSLAFMVKQFPLLLFPDFLVRVGRSRQWGAAALSAVPVLAMSLPFLVWSPAQYLFFLAGNVSAWRQIYRGEWWNPFGYLAAGGVPEPWLKAVSLALLAGAVGWVTWAGWRRRLSAIAVAALIANAFWMFYHSSMATYVGWGLALGTIAAGSAWRAPREA